MGQYYKPVFTDSAVPGERKILAWAYSHRYDNGLKLMEHSYVGNIFLAAVFRGLFHYSHHLVWAGDYADPEPGSERNLYDMAQDPSNEIVIPGMPENTSQYDPKRKCWTDTPEWRAFKKTPEAPIYKRGTFVYAINLTKNEYVRLSGQPKVDGLQICPLPLLCADGNGRGGGDYRSSASTDYVGSWAGDRIKIVTFKMDLPWGCQEIKPLFHE